MKQKEKKTHVYYSIKNTRGYFILFLIYCLSNLVDVSFGVILQISANKTINKNIKTTVYSNDII